MNDDDIHHSHKERSSHLFNGILNHIHKDIERFEIARLRRHRFDGW